MNKSKMGSNYYGVCFWPVDFCKMFVNDLALGAGKKQFTKLFHNGMCKLNSNNTTKHNSWKLYRNAFFLCNKNNDGFVQEENDFVHNALFSPQPLNLRGLKMNTFLIDSKGKRNSYSGEKTGDISIIHYKYGKFPKKKSRKKGYLIEHFIDEEVNLYNYLHDKVENDSFGNFIQEILRKDHLASELTKSSTANFNVYYTAAVSFYGDEYIDALICVVLHVKKPSEINLLKSKLDDAFRSNMNIIINNRNNFFITWLKALKNNVLLNFDEKLMLSKQFLSAYLGYPFNFKDLKHTGKKIDSFDLSNITFSVARAASINQKIKKINEILEHHYNPVFLKGPLAKPALYRLGQIAHNTKLNNIIILSGPPGSGKGAAAKEFHAQYMKLVKTEKKIFFKDGIQKVIDRLTRIGTSKLGTKDEGALVNFIARQLGPANYKGEINNDSSTAWVTDVINKLLNKDDEKFEWNFFEINCGTLSDDGVSLNNSIKVLFGENETPGLFQLASYLGGTLFLDEIADLPIHLQDMLLKPLEEETVTRLGWEAYPEKVENIRIVVATYKNLKTLGQQYQSSLATGLRKGFRPDLYTRLWKNKPVQLCSISDYFLGNNENKQFHKEEWVKIVKGKDINNQKLTAFLNAVYSKIDTLIHNLISDKSLADQEAIKIEICSGMTMRFYKQIKKIYMLHPNNTTKHYILEEYIPEMFDSIDKKTVH